MSTEPPDDTRPDHLPAPVPAATALRDGTLCRYEVKNGFGYVEDDENHHRYIFVVGKAIRHTDARQMQVGERVQFNVDRDGRVTQLRRC